MPDYFQRRQAPLSDSQWAALDRMVVSTAQAMLVGRRFISLVGPFGPGVEIVPSDTIAGNEVGHVDLLGNDEDQPVRIERRRFLPLPLLYKDFWLHWRDLDLEQRFGVPTDSGEAAAAAASVALAEDLLIFDGDPLLPASGLRTVDGRQVLPMSDWNAQGKGFADVVNGMRLLVSQGFAGPYALAVSPVLYANLNRVFDATGVLELEQVEKLARRGVYASAVLPEPSALLVDSGPQNMDLAVGVDLTTAFVQSASLNYQFRVIESLVPRIRRPAAICSFELTTTSGESSESTSPRRR